MNVFTYIGGSQVRGDNDKVARQNRRCDIGLMANRHTGVWRVGNRQLIPCGILVYVNSCHHVGLIAYLLRLFNKIHTQFGAPRSCRSICAIWPSFPFASNRFFFHIFLSLMPVGCWICPLWFSFRYTCIYAVKNGKQERKSNKKAKTYVRLRPYIHTCRSYAWPALWTYRPAHGPRVFTSPMRIAHPYISNFWLLGEQSFPKWEIPCPGRRW